MPGGDERFVVLVVDDAPEHLSMAVKNLEDRYTVKVARSGAKAISIASTPPRPDLILLDIMMPEMDGFEVCIRLKADRLLAQIPVIFLTSKSETEDIVKGFSLGAADYVSKPFQVEELLARVRTHLEIKHSKDVISRKIDEQRELLHILCHDLSNPFANILSVLQVMGSDPRVMEEYVPMLRDSAKNGTEVIELVRLMRAAEEKPLPLGQLDLGNAMDESLRVLHFMMQAKGIEARVDIPRGMSVVAERTSLVNSVINNLLTNAVKFSPPGSAIDIPARREGDAVWLTVRDHGIGMPPELLADLFDIRKTTSRPGTEGESGTGFGMPLVRKFVEAYGGSLEVTSTEEASGGEDHGTEIRIRLRSAR